MKKRICLIILIMFSIINVCVLADELEINSTHYGIYNSENMKLLYGKDVEEQVSIASITKLMTAVTCVDNIEDINAKVVVNGPQIYEYINPDLVVAGIYDQEELTYYDLLATMLLPSGADSAVCIACNVFGDYDTFISKMNEKAIEIGMNNSSFVNPTGLDQEGNYSTIHDVALLMQYALKNGKIKEIISIKEYTTSDSRVSVYNTIEKMSEHYGQSINYIKGGKTGTTYNAGLCLVSYAVDEDVNLIGVVTGTDMYSSVPFNIIDTEKLYEYVSNKYSKSIVIHSGDKLLEIPTYCTKEDSVKYYFNEDISVYVDEVDNSKLDIFYDGINLLNSKIEEGATLGNVKVYYDDELLKEYEIKLENNLQFSLFKWMKIHPLIIILIIVLLIAIIITSVIIFLVIKTNKQKEQRKNSKMTKKYNDKIKNSKNKTKIKKE